MKKSALVLLTLTILALVAGVVFLALARRAALFPIAQPPGVTDMMGMPPVVSASMEELLRALDAEVQRHQPDVAAALLPGVSAEALARAEQEMGASIHPEMQQLYRWHNGLPEQLELFPGFAFVGLDAAVQSNKQLNADLQQRGYGAMFAHEQHWLVLFPDGGGDGYYYDPARPYASGGVFYNFRETGYFIEFPSIKNLLAAIVECYRLGAYFGDGQAQHELERQIMLRYGVERVQ